MTREELLAKIQSDYEENKHFRDQPKWKPFAALRAVVELHQPMDPTWDDGFIACEICNYEYDRNEPYPCPTIQAVEKELM